MPLQPTSASDLTRQKRLITNANVVPKVKAGNLKPSNAVITPVRITAVNSAVFLPPTLSNNNFTTGVTKSATTHLKF